MLINTWESGPLVYYVVMGDKTYKVVCVTVVVCIRTALGCVLYALLEDEREKTFGRNSNFRRLFH